MRRSRRSVIGVLVTAGTLGLLPVAVPNAIADDPCTRVDKIVDEQDRVSEKIDLYQEDASVALDQLNGINEDIAKGEARVAELQAQVGQLQVEIGDLAVRTFVSGDQIGGVSSLLTNSNQITEAVEREQYAQLAINQGQASTDDLDATLHELDLEQQRLTDKRNTAENYKKQLEQATAKAEQYHKDLEQLEAKTRAQCSAAIAAERKRRQEAALAQAQQLLAQQQANAGRASNNSGGGNSGGGNSGGGNSGGGNSGGGDSGGSSGGSGGNGAGSYVPAVSHGASGAVQAATSQLGVPYKFATAQPGVAFDCSGLTSWAWGQAGVYLPHQSRAQYASTAHVSPEQAQAGDLIFFHNPISHVALYLGNGTMIHAVHSGTVVSISAVNWGKVVGVGRPG